MGKRTLTAATTTSLVAALAAFGATTASADAVCQSPGALDRCYSQVMNASTSANIYQATVNQTWVCQTVPSASDFALNTMWTATADGSWVEFGIVTGAMHASAPTSQASRDWYAARASTSGGWYSEHMPVAYKPSRSVAYTTTTRYNGADWILFHGNTQFLVFSGPDAGRIRYVFGGSETTHSNSKIDGRQNGHSHQLWGRNGKRCRVARYSNPRRAPRAQWLVLGCNLEFRKPQLNLNL